MRVRKIKDVDNKIETLSYIIKQYPKQDINIKSLFKNDNPIHVEIGCGKGNFIINHALKNKDINYIGIEKDKSVIYKAGMKINSREKLDNLILIHMDAKDIKELFKENKIDKLYLNFSDPWPKSRHEKRRLTSPVLIKNMLDLLAGDLEFKTDNRKLFEYTVQTFNSIGLDISDISCDLHADYEDVITTEYEDKFIEKGNVIYYIKVQKK